MDDDAVPEDEDDPADEGGPPADPLDALTESVLGLGDLLAGTAEVPLDHRVGLTKDAVHQVVHALDELHRRQPGLVPFSSQQWMEIDSLYSRVSALERGDEAAADTIGLSLFRIGFAVVAGAVLAGPLAALVPSTWTALGAETLKAAIGAAAGAVTAEVLRPVEAGIRRRRELNTPDVGRDPDLDPAHPGDETLPAEPLRRGPLGGRSAPGSTGQSGTTPPRGIGGPRTDRPGPRAGGTARRPDTGPGSGRRPPSRG